MKAEQAVLTSENASQGTADNTQVAGLSQAKGVTQTLGNTLGQKQSLNMSNYIGYYTAPPRDSLLIDQTKAQLNLSHLLANNLLEEDGIEDIHFYFVSFNQHKKLIL
jgi:hypothetical protein